MPGFGLSGLAGWEKGVLASRLLFVATAVFAGAGVFLASGQSQRLLFGGAVLACVGAFGVGYKAQQAYLAAETPAPGGDD